MGYKPTQIENGHIVFHVDGSTHQVHRGPVGKGAANPQRFTGNPLPFVSGAPWWDTSGVLAQPCAPATPWFAVAFPSPLVRCG